MSDSRRPSGHGTTRVHSFPRGLGLALLLAISIGFLSACVSRRGAVPDADPSTIDAIAADPVFAEAIALEGAGRYREAIDEYERIRSESRDGATRGRATYRMGLAYLGIGNERLARDEFAKVADTTDDPTIVAPALLELGGLRMRDGTWIMAETALRRALEMGLSGSDAERAHYQLAVACQQGGRSSEAREHYAKAGSWRPGAGEGYAYAPPAEASPRDATQPPVAKGRAPASSRNPKLGFDYIGRAAWNATASRANSDPMGRVTRITVHHSGLHDDATQYADCANMMKKMQRTHVQDRGWADLGYHFIIDRTGRVWEGRPIEIQGAHAGNNDANQGNVGVALSGDFDTQQPTAKQKQALRRVVESLMTSYRVPALRIATHREVRRAFNLSVTECPGKNLQIFVDSLRKELAASERRAGAGGAALASSPARKTAPAAR